ncbi:MAG TPA: hypothetical protein VGF69_08185 [Thermoanaerobaculia bacterium]|jgi:hypothetical protein
MSRLGTFTLLALLTTASASAQAVTPNVERGFASEKAYSFDGVDSVGLFNGNLGVSIPIGQRYAVGGSLSYQLMLSYGGNNWEFSSIDERPDPNNPSEVITYNWAYPSRRDNAGFGWQLHLGRLLAGAVAGCANESPFGPIGTKAPGYLSPETRTAITPRRRSPTMMASGTTGRRSLRRTTAVNCTAAKYAPPTTAATSPSIRRATIPARTTPSRRIPVRASPFSLRRSHGSSAASAAARRSRAPRRCARTTSSRAPPAR